jgi:hypothetical protein
VKLRVDDAGVEAARFGAATSGTVLLYDGSGHLLFNGGITESRGHEGFSAGREMLAHLLAQPGHEMKHTAVYGCPLFDATGAEQRGGPSCQR